MGFRSKKTAVKIMKEKIKDNEKTHEGGKSKWEDKQNHKQFGKDQPRVRDILKARIEKKRKSNMKKINTIKIKKVVN